MQNCSVAGCSGIILEESWLDSNSCSQFLVSLLTEDSVFKGNYLIKYNKMARDCASLHSKLFQK